jgi:hypothetical protein
VWRLECTPRVPNACSHSADGGHRLVGGDGKPTAVRSKPHQRAEPVWQGGHALPHLQGRHDGVVLSRMRCRRHLRRMVRQAHTPTDTPHHDTSPVNRCSGGGVQSVLARRGGTALGGGLSWSSGEASGMRVLSVGGPTPATPGPTPDPTAAPTGRSEARGGGHSGVDRVTVARDDELGLRLGS